MASIPNDRSRRSAFQVTTITLATLAAVLIVGLLAMVLFVSVHQGSAGLTIENYRQILHDPVAGQALLNTLGFALVSVAVAMLLGLPVAWLVERTDLPGKRLLYSAVTVGIVIPGFFFGIAFSFLFDPDAGLVNKALMSAFNLSQGPINVASVQGMGIVEGFALAPLVFILTASSLRAVDPSLEEAAECCGASRIGILRRVTLPLVYPGILGAAIFVFTVAIAAFDIPLIIGQSRRILTFSTYLFQKMNPAQGFGVIPYGQAAAFSSVMIVVALILSVWYTRVLGRGRRFQVVTGRGYRPKLVRLGKGKFLAWGALSLYFIAGIVVTLIVTLWTAFQPFAGRPLSIQYLQYLTLDNFSHLPWDTVVSSAVHTLLLMILGPTIALVFALAFSWFVLRTRFRLRLAYDFIAFLPQGVPSAIFAFAAFVLALFYLPVLPSQFYRSMALLVIVWALVYVAFATRLTNAALVQLHPELEEAGQISGASHWAVLRRITIPLIRPALVTGWVWMAFLAFRELTVTAMLGSPDNQTMSVVVYQQWTSNETYAAALTVIMLAVMIPVIPVLWRLTRRQVFS
ncbi:MAG: iron ABC transporter permease [Candidatus Dormibacteraeota bacterium]|nr:iron ABC transporter permease [Candidatus Dormibacteraeota bacterium]